MTTPNNSQIETPETASPTAATAAHTHNVRLPYSRQSTTVECRVPGCTGNPTKDQIVQSLGTPLTAEQFDRAMLELGFTRSFYRGRWFAPLDPDEIRWNEIRWSYVHEEIGGILGGAIWCEKAMPDGRHDYDLTLRKAKERLTRARRRRRLGWSAVAVLLTTIVAWFAAGTASAATDTRITIRDYDAGIQINHDACTVLGMVIYPNDGESFLSATCEGEGITPINRPMWPGMVFDAIAVDLRDWQACRLTSWYRFHDDVEHIEFDCGSPFLFIDSFEATP